MPVLVAVSNKSGYKRVARTVHALATPMRQYSCTLGYALFLPFLVLGQKFSTQSRSLTIFGGRTIFASSVPEISSEMTFRILSRFDGSSSM